MAFLWSLWPLNLNRWLFQLKLLHMIHISWKNYKILKFWVLDFGFGLQNFFGLWRFVLRSLVSKKSSSMQKSYIWAIFHAKQFLLPIFHSGSLCIKKQLPRTSNLLSYNLLKSNFPQPLVKHVVFVEFKPRKLEDDGKHAGWTFSLNCKGLPSFKMI